jgi:hypothetical protein
LTLKDRLRRAATPLVAVGILGTVAVTGAAPATAQNAAAPTPGCDGLLFEDPAGDQRVNAIPLGGSPPTPAPAKDNVDIRAGWINHTTDAAGKVTVTANIQVTNLTKETEEGAFALIYNFQWTDDEGANKYAQAQVEESGTAFSYGTSGTEGYTTDGSTTGKLHEGANGVISIVLPKGVAPAGKTLSETNANAANVYGNPGATYFFPENDAATGKNYRVAPCAGGGTTPPSGGGNETPPQQATPFDASASPSTLKAKKVKKAKSVTFTVDAREALSNARFDFKKGSKVLGSAAKATFTKGKIALKLAKKGLKKGSYSLVVSGTRANGASASDTIKIKVK